MTGSLIAIIACIVILALGIAPIVILVGAWRESRRPRRRFRARGSYDV